MRWWPVCWFLRFAPLCGSFFLLLPDFLADDLGFQRVAANDAALLHVSASIDVHRLLLQRAIVVVRQQGEFALRQRDEATDGSEELETDFHSAGGFDTAQ